MNTTQYQIGDTVCVEPKDGYPSSSFIGTIIKHIKETDDFVVQDQDDDAFLVERDQLSDDYFDGTVEE